MHWISGACKSFKTGNVDFFFTLSFQVHAGGVKSIVRYIGSVHVYPCIPHFSLYNMMETAYTGW